MSNIGLSGPYAVNQSSGDRIDAAPITKQYSADTSEKSPCGMINRLEECDTYEDAFCGGRLVVAAAAVKHTTRTLSGPPSTGAAIALDGGVADTACYYTGR